MIEAGQLYRRINDVNEFVYILDPAYDDYDNFGEQNICYVQVIRIIQTQKDVINCVDYYNQSTFLCSYRLVE